MAAFKFADPETGEITETDDPLAFWMHIREAVDRAIEEQSKARKAAGGLRFALGQLRADRDYAESMMRLTDAVQAGKNAEERKSLLEQGLRGDQYWIDLNTRIGEAEHDTGIHEANADAAHSRFRARLRDLEVLAAIYSPQEERA